MKPKVLYSARSRALAVSLGVFMLLNAGAALAAGGSGTASVSPASDVAAGRLDTWTVRYTAAEPFSSGTVSLVIPDGWTGPQDTDGFSAGYVTVLSEGALGAPAISIAGRTITISVDTLDPGQTIDIVYGDGSVDPGGRAAAQTVVESGVQFTVRSDPGGYGNSPIAASPTLNVIAADIARLSFLTAPQSFAADGESAVIRVRAEDQYGNPAQVTSNQDIALESTAGSGRFSLLGGSNFIETSVVVIASGLDTVSFYYRDSVAGEKTITASASGQSWTDAQQAVTIEPAAPFSLMISPGDTTATAGDFARYRLSVEDAFGNASPISADQAITLLGQPGSFYTTSNHATPISAIVIPSGSDHVFLDYRNTSKDVENAYFLAFLDANGVPPTLESASALIYIDNASLDPATSEIMVLTTTAIANGVDSIRITVRAKDEFYNGVDGSIVVISSTGSGNILRQPSGVTGGTGSAAGSIKSTKAEGKTLTATIDGIPIVPSSAVTFTPGPFSPAVSDVGVDKITAASDGTDSVTVTALVTDAQGNPIPGSAVSFEVTGTLNTIVPSSGVTGADGRLVGKLRSTKAELKTVSARVGGVLVTNTRNVTFVPGAFSATASDVQVDKTTATANGIDSVTVTALVTDAQGNPIPGSAVSFEVTGTLNTIAPASGVTGADGRLVGKLRSTKAELKTVSARVGGVLVTNTENVTFVPGAFSATASDVQVDKTTATANGIDSVTVTALVTDAQGNPISGSFITLEATGTSNTIMPSSGVTGADGRLVGKLRSTKAELKTVSARVGGTLITTTQSVTFVPGGFSATASDVQVDKTTATADGVDAVGVTVTVRDGQGNPIAGAAVTIEATGTSNTITQPVGVTGANGVATGSVRSTKAELKTVSARVGGVLVTNTENVTFVPGGFNASVSDVQVDKTTATANGIDSVTVTALVTDAQGNPISGSFVTLEATGTSNTITPSSGVTGADGRLVGKLRSTKAELKTVSARVGGVLVTNTENVTFVPGGFNASVSDVQVDKTTATANGIDSVTVTALVTDAQGNPIPGSAVSFEVTGTLNTIAPVSGVTGADGRLVGKLRSTKAELKTVSARVGGVLVTNTENVTFMPGAFSATASDVQVDKTTATADGVDAVGVTVTVRDGQGNPIAGAAVTIEATGTSNTITQPVGVTGANGVATGSVRSTKAELKTVSARVGGVLVTNTENVTFVPGAFSATASDVQVDKTTATANGIDSVTVTALVTDAQGNPIPGSAVSFEVTGTLNTIVPSSGVTGADGRLVGKLRSTKAELKTVSARVGGTLITTTQSVTFVPGGFSATASDVQVDKTTATADGVDAVGVTVTVRDGQGNPIAGAAVTIEATGTSNTITQPVGVTGANGVATGSVRSTKAELKTVSARVGGVLVTNTENVTFIPGGFSASASDVQVDKTTATADGVDAVGVTVTVRDGQGNPIAGAAVTIEATGTSNTITQPVGVTGANGVATGSVRSTKAELKTVSARVGGVLVTNTRNVTFVPGAFSATASDVQVDKTTATADGVDAVAVTVIVRDGQGNGIPGRIVAIDATGSGNVITQPAGVTDANGIAVGSLKSTVAQAKTISATAGGSGITKTVGVSFVSGVLHHFVVTHAGSTTAGFASPVTIDARDSQNNRIVDFSGIAKVYTNSTIPGDFITWGIGSAAGSILSESGDTILYQFVPADLGDAELRITDTKVESITIYASSGSVLSSSAAPLAVNHAAADRIAITSGDAQHAVVNQEVASPLVVRVEDAFGNAVPGVTVSWAIESAGGYFDASRSTPGQQTSSTTNAAGSASGELWRLGTASAAASDSITATMPTGTTRSLLFTATADRGPVSSIVLAPASKSVTVNSPTVVTATLRDAYGNTAANEYVTIYIKDYLDGHLSRAAGSTTDSLSPSARMGVSGAAGTVSVTYNAPAAAGLSDAIDAYHNLVPAANVVDAVYTTVASGATDLSATVVSGRTSQAGVSFMFRVEAVDGNGNRDLTNTSRVILEPPPGGGFTFSLTDFGAPVTQADLAAGAVTLYGRGTKTGVWQISVRDNATILSPDQFDVTIAPNDTVSSYAVIAPAGATAGADFAVSAEARDRFGNRATTAGYAINFRAVQAADSSLAASGTLSVSSGSLVNGLYTGSSFRYNVAEPIRVEVTSAANAIKGYSGVIAVDNAAAYRLVKIGGDSAGVQVGDSVRLRARVFDIHGNAVDAHAVYFAIQEGNGHLEAPQALTDASGAVSLWFRTDTIRGANRARASILDAIPEELETQGFTVSTVPESAIASVVLGLAGTTFQAGQPFAGTIAAYDRYGNLIDTDSSSQLRCVARKTSMTFVPGVMTLAAGRSSFSASDTSAGVNRIRVLSLAGDSLSDWSGPLTIHPAPAYRIVEVRGDTLGVPVGSKAGLKARVSDQYGNAVSSEIVRFVITSSLGGSPSLWDGTGAPGDGLVLTDATGAAVCSLTTDTHAGTNTVSASILDANPPALERVVFSVGTAAGTIARFDVLPDGYLKTAGQSFSLQLIAYDLDGNEAVDDDTSRVVLASGGAAVFSINPVTLTKGRASLTAYDNVAEKIALRAQTLGGGALSVSDTITVMPAAPSGAIAFQSIAPGTITANGASISTITTNPIRDVYGNVVSSGTLVRVTPSIGSIGSEDKDPSTPLTVERQTEASGAVSVFVRSGTTPGVSQVQFQSLTGSASGIAAVTFAPPPACTYAGYLTPRHLIPTQAAAFRCSVANGSTTGLTLTTQTSISFADSASNVYEAHLPAPVALAGSVVDTLDFVAVIVPAGMLGGTYTPRVKIVGSDAHGAPYQTEFNAGSNSVSISNIDIVRVTAPSIVSRGDTFAVDVRLKNGGGSTVNVTEIVPSFEHGYFAATGSWNPPLPDGLPAGSERTYRRSMYVLANSPLGADTIDAAVTAAVNGSSVQDVTAYPNVAPIFVQSAASIAYVPGSLSPATVSKGQSHLFSISLANGGQASVILDGALTRLTFTDGVSPVIVALGSTGALPGNTTTPIVFPSAGIPAGMASGSYPVSVLLAGTENGTPFADTLVLGNPVHVVQPAQLAYHAGSITPTPVSKRSSVAFAVGVDNTGGAAVECDPDSTWITFASGPVVYLARLDGSRGRTVVPGSNTLYFQAVVVPDAMPTGSYQPAVRVKGTENGLTFSTVLAPAGLVAVQNPPQLAISSTKVVPSDSITADQTAPWFASIRVDNNGGATVQLDSLALRLYAGSQLVSGECVLTPLNFQAHVDSLRGGEGKDILVRFNDNPAGSMTTGTIVIESAVWGRDRNSGVTLVATTELGGKGSYLVQTPANVVFASIIASADTVTALQTRNWSTDVVVRNTGQSDVRLDLDPAKSFITFSTSADFAVVFPTGLAGGGNVLEGGSTDTLRYAIDRTGSVPGLCRVEAAVSGVEINSGRALSIASGASGIRDNVLVQTPAAIAITGFTPLQNPVTVAQERDWAIDMSVSNSGQSDVTLLLDRIDSTWVALPGGSGFSIENPAIVAGDGRTLHGGSSGILRFVVRTTGSIPPGPRVLEGLLLASEINSGRALHASMPAASSADSVTFQLRPDPRYEAASLTPTVVSSGTGVSFELAVTSDNALRSTLMLDPPAVTMSFGDADGDTFRSTLSPVSDNELARGGETVLLFNTGTVDASIARGKHAVVLHLEGAENGNPFEADIPVFPDSVVVEEAPQLAINRIVVPQSATASQTAPWPVRMILRNNGEASVAVDFSVLQTFITFTIVGLGDRTYEYEISRPDHLEGSLTDTLAGGSIDSLIFTVTRTGSTGGLALVNGRVAGLDVNSGLTLVDDTYSGGWSHVAIETPGIPAITAAVPSRAAVTSAQTTPWQLTLTVCNNGEADLALVLDSAYVFYDGRVPLSHAAPIGFVEGGLVLEGGSCKHLVFAVSPAPGIPGGADIALHAHAGFVELNSAVYSAFDTRQAGSGSGAVRVQAPARIRIAQTVNQAPRSPYVNYYQQFGVSYEVINDGEARADSIRLALEKSGSSQIIDTLLVIDGLSGGSSASGAFAIAAGAASGSETFRARLRGAVDANSREAGLVVLEPALDDTAAAVVQRPAALTVASVRPSQREVNAGQDADWAVSVSFTNGGEAPLALDAPGAGDLAFSLFGSRRFDYLVIAPDTLGSGPGLLAVPGGGADSLIYRIAATGVDTGTIAIDAGLAWGDLNDPLRDPAPAAGFGSVHVKAPSGLRIISVASDAPNNALFPNTSVVDTGQVFNVIVRVENTGGDDLDSVSVNLVSNGASRAAVVGDGFVSVASGSERDFVFSVTAAPAPGNEALSASIVYAVSVNTGERVYPAQAAESTENLRIELPALLACGLAITAPAGALDGILSTGQIFTVTAAVANEGQALVDTTGEVTLALPPAVLLANPGEPLAKRLGGLGEVSWRLVAPAIPSLDTVRARISGIPVAVNTGAPAAARVVESAAPLRTEESARLTGCAISIAAPQGAVDGTLSTEQNFLARAVLTPPANADSVWVELSVPVGFSVTGDRVRLIGAGTGAQQTIDWITKAPVGRVVADTLVVRAGGKDINSGIAIATCRVVFAVHVETKPSLAVAAAISGPPEALDGSVSVSLPFTIEASAAKSGDAAIDTAGARMELVLPAGQGYALDGAQEHFRKPFYPGRSVAWNVRAPGAPTSPGNIEVRLIEPYATDVNTNAACEISTGAAFIPVQTEAGAVLMSNISRGDSIPPFVVPQGARNVPLLRIVLTNASGFTVGLDTLFVTIEDGRGNSVADPSRIADSIAIAVNGAAFGAAVAGVNPVPIVVAHGFTLAPGTSDTLLLEGDIGARASGSIAFEIERSASVVVSISDSGARIGVSLDLDGGDIAGNFLTGPLSIMSSQFDEYAHNYPNPFRAGSESTKICYFLKKNSAVAIKIYDLAGHLVWTRNFGAGDAEAAGSAEGAYHEIPWNGRNDRGELVRNGVYMCKVEAGSQSALFKIAVAK